MSFLGLFTFTAPYLPWVILGFGLMLGQSPVFDLLGILIGHIYYYLEDVLPQLIGRRVLITPTVVCVDDSCLPLLRSSLLQSDALSPGQCVAALFYSCHKKRHFLLTAMEEERVLADTEKLLDVNEKLSSCLALPLYPHTPSVCAVGSYPWWKGRKCR